MSKAPLWKKSLVSAICGTILIVGSVVYAGNWLYNFALNTKNKKGLGSSAGEKLDIGDEEDLLKKSQTENRDWILERKRDIYTISEDHLILHAYQIMAREAGHRYAIICHGYKGRAWNMGLEAAHFYENGWNLILPDARGHGESEGSSVGMGWPERRDVLCWIERIIKEDADAEIMVFGSSMGAATVMMAVGEVLPKQVKLMIEDCGYSSVWDEFSHQIKAMFHLPVYPILPVASFVTRIRAGYTFKQASAVEQLKKCEIPALFIHGDQDTFVPYAMLDKVYEAAAGPKEKLVVEGAGHGLSVLCQPELYWETVDKFIDTYL